MPPPLISPAAENEAFLPGAEKTRSGPPRSVAGWADPFLIAAVIVAAYVALRKTGLDSMQLTLVLVGAVMACMIPAELMRSPLRRCPRPVIPFLETLHKAAIKTVGIYAELGLVLLAWMLVPEYMRGDYRPLFEAMPFVLPPLPFLIFAWVLWTEWRLGPAEDHGWHFGMMVLQRYKQVDWESVRNALFSLLVRGFFLPLNFCAAVATLDIMRGKEDAILNAGWPGIVTMLDHVIRALLLIAITPGYLFGARILGTETKKTDQSWFGWMVTLLCYPPINRGTGTGWFVYESMAGFAFPWITRFGSSGTASCVAGAALVFLYLVHYWGESICCLRSSHLSNRGIITNGPFRFCKHPVYAAKCLAWAIAFLPFSFGPGMRTDLAYALSFFAFCCVYGMRAWVEERLLSTDPDYVAYALWMDKHSLFGFMGRRFPFLSFAWRLKRWQKNHANRSA